LSSFEVGHLAGYAGDVWYHSLAEIIPWRRMPNHAICPIILERRWKLKRDTPNGIELLSRFLENRPLEQHA
jgi:hypothetical protein